MTVALLVLAYVNLRGHLPAMHSVTDAVASADLVWILVAALCQATSLAMFARQQRSLLGALGVRMSGRRALAVTYARSALAYSMPAGLAVSAAFAFDQFRRSGASKDRAAAVTVLSGGVSVLGLGGLCVAGVLSLVAVEPDQALASHPAIVSVTAGAIMCALLLTLWQIRRRRVAPVPTPGIRHRDAPDGWIGRARTALRQAVTACRSISARDWAIASAYAAGAWLFDALCLVAAAAAFRLPVGLFTVVTMYLGVQIVLQLPITPGGIGLIEAGLLAGLTHAGAGVAAAAAAVLTYRVLSCWAIIPLGGVAWFALRGRPVPEVARTRA